jgi:hypothetical protein
MSDAVAFLGLLAVVAGLWMTWWTVRVDRLRSKRQATIEQWIALQESSRKSSDVLGPYGSSHTELTMDDPFWHDRSSDLQIAYVRTLNDLEHFAVGINMDTYDLATFSRLAGSQIIRRINSSRLLIGEVRTRTDHAYVDVEELAVALAELRGDTFAPIETDWSQASSASEPPSPATPDENA